MLWPRDLSIVPGLQLHTFHSTNTVANTIDPTGPGVLKQLHHASSGQTSPNRVIVETVTSLSYRHGDSRIPSTPDYFSHISAFICTSSNRIAQTCIIMARDLIFDDGTLVVISALILDKMPITHATVHAWTELLCLSVVA